MLARTHRFHGYGSLNSVYKRGQTVRGPSMNLRFASRDPKRPYRAAIVVSRKVNKSAVVRNRIRRLIYEVVRQNAAAIPPGTDLVFTVFSDQVADWEAVQLETVIIEMIQKAISILYGHSQYN